MVHGYSREFFHGSPDGFIGTMDHDHIWVGTTSGWVTGGTMSICALLQEGPFSYGVTVVSY